MTGRPVDEWQAEYPAPSLPMIQTTDVLTAAVPVIQAELRERIAAQIEAFGAQHPRWHRDGTHYVGCWVAHSECALAHAVSIVRGEP